ncbi:hypothetical protein CC86DRAFT_378039 [Ophiobolus disseminans]|uniref:Peptidase metallopeptidase domain-containing protein n=1 Tax=Ophiobolus disseminans TaxID=1469910 RepID=A0A6A7AD24_9PLEO|nr:hypothetical protein CC86DRAFT_378039 [Ophiobolus disseminans]
MTPFALLLLLGYISVSVAASHRNVARGTIALIPSASPTRVIPPAATADQKRHSKHVNDFYKLYGWLKPNTTIQDLELPKAIRKIQKALKEPVDGVFSDKMMDIMTKPRCGVEEPYNVTAAEAPADVHKRYVLWGSKWSKTTLTWRFTSYTNDISQGQQQSTVSNAFAQWMNYIPLNFQQASSNAKADIYIGFRPLGRDDTRYGFTSMVSDGVAFQSGSINVTFNDDYAWSDDRLFSYTAVHEIGHALGLSHSAVESAVMFAYFGGYIRPLNSDDKMGIHNIYGWKNPRWSRIEANTGTKDLIQVTTSSSTASSNDGLYQLRSNGQILRYTNNAWTSVDNNPDTAQITGSGGKLYQRHFDGSTYLWTGNGQAWNYIGAASENVIDIVAASDQLYSRRKDGWVARWSGSGSSWLSVEQPTASVSKEIAITDSKTLWNLLNTGDLVRSTWPHSSGSWEIVDINTANVAIAVGGEDFYKLQSDGQVVFLNMKEYYWQIIENAGSVAIFAADEYLYSKHDDGSVWRYTRTQWVWEQLDFGRDVSSVVGDRSGNVWEMLEGGDVWKLVS